MVAIESNFDTGIQQGRKKGFNYWPLRPSHMWGQLKLETRKQNLYQILTATACCILSILYMLI